MKRIFSVTILVAAFSLLLTACWFPGVDEVPITAPWDKMNLPVKDTENARVYTSNPKMLRVMHREGKLKVANAYAAALEKQGWELKPRDSGPPTNRYIFEKGDERIELDVYDYEPTGVILEKKWATTDDPGFTVASADTPDFVLTAEQYYRDSEGANRTKNKEKYTDKIVEISGRVYETNSARSNRVILYADQPHSVFLTIANESREETEKLKKDEPAVFKCRGGRHGTGLRWCLLMEAKGKDLNE